MAIADLTNVIAYSMFDMSYEGSYLELPEDHMDDETFGFQNDKGNVALSSKEASEMEAAVNEIRGWKFGKDEDWHRDTLIQLITGKQRYEELPNKGD
ncbi:hypothetical protein LZ32DRAFT_606177 [Colletotrichum eremochloae]|nr:hypothetical protein LZ32DRAFT_606177 [Colletotrichum eremochloae]